MAFVAFLFGFLLGAVVLLALEGLILYWVVRRLGRKKVVVAGKEPEPDAVEQWAQSYYPYEKQGVVWVLDQDKLPRSCSDPQIKETKELKSKKDTIETSPVKKNAKIIDHYLILTGNDDSQRSIPLLDCSVLAVSSTNLPSRKWYKRYPVIIENKNTLIYDGRKTCYLYFETSSEKESWCKALRLASNSDKMKMALYAELQEGFNSYLLSLAVDYPLFQKPSRMLSESTEKSIKIEEPPEPPSRIRHFFKKFARKASRIGYDYKSNVESLSTRADKKIGDKLRISQDALSTSGSTRSTSSSSYEKSSFRDVVPPASSFPVSDSPSNEKGYLDEGTLCLNMLLARLFFDAKRSTEINNLITTRLQRTLSNVRTPNYIGGITCTSLNVGNLPPYIHQVRTLPVDMKEVCALEVDIEYSGGFTIEIETRLDVREPEFQGIVDTSLEQNSAEDTTSDLLEDFESYSNELNFKTSTSFGNDKQDGNRNEGLRTSKSSSWASTYKARWKTIVNSMAEHVSQVPITLAIKVASLRGTLCLRIKPPPSDQLWYGFTSMPEIDFSLDSSFGDRKISSSHVGLIIANRLKVAIRESIVLPNCESICIPWMSAEKDDWLPRNAAPYMWLRQENNELPRKVAANSQVTVESRNKSDQTIKFDSGKGKISSSSNTLNNDEEKRNSSDSFQLSGKESVLNPAASEIGSTSFSSDESCSKIVLEDLKVPLLENCDNQVTLSKKNYNDPVSGSPSIAEPVENLSISSSEVVTQPTLPTQEDPKAKKNWRRGKMMDLGKRMGEKFEEKRRHIEEKGRHMVEKIKESSKASFDGSSLGGSISGGPFR